MLSLQNSIKNALALEVKALEEMVNNFNYEELEIIVDLICNCPSRVVFCGLGKSGHIAKKIAATWSSIGRASIFLHASEALHGDLGVLMPNDLIISVSNSGETDELLRLTSSIRLLKLKHIAFVGNSNSTLARSADYFVNIGANNELLAHMNLSSVPLASCLTTLALGDLLTVLIVEKTQLKPQDFRALHPGGNIGQKLLMQVKEKMHDKNLPIAKESTSMRELLMLMSKGSLGMVVICDDLQQVKAIITDGDIRRALQKHEDEYFFKLVAKDIATYSPKILQQEATLFEADDLMTQYKITALPIINKEGKLVGILSKHQL